MIGEVELEVEAEEVDMSEFEEAEDSVSEE